MYIDKDKQGKIHLMNMNVEDAAALKRMIEGASLLERRRFNHILIALKDMPLF